MTQTNAERAANVLIGAAVAGAAYYVLKTSSLRRVAWRLVVTGLTGTLPGWFRQEIEQGWKQSGRIANAPRAAEHAAAGSSAV